MKKPVIGITCPWSVETWGDSIDSGGYYYVGRPYVKSVYKYGGIPILIVPEYEKHSIEKYLDEVMNIVDGILFTGGGDVKRKFSGKFPNLREQQESRYFFEENLMKKAYEKNKAILGICRGYQMIIEVFGGSLAEDTIDGHSQNLPGWEPWHKVKINKDSELYKIIELETWEVNSFHVQKAERIPEGFIVSVEAEDGVIEGIEAKDYPFLTGFQFHPEELEQKDKKAGKIIEWFIKKAKQNLLE